MSKQNEHFHVNKPSCREGILKGGIKDSFCFVSYSPCEKTAGTYQGHQTIIETFVKITQKSLIIHQLTKYCSVHIHILYVYNYIFCKNTIGSSNRTENLSSYRYLSHNLSSNTKNFYLNTNFSTVETICLETQIYIVTPIYLNFRP